jgi:ABC-type glycerol-3-phosphate transport system substrate-binding protein
MSFNGDNAEDQEADNGSDDDHPLLGQETQDAVAELTDAAENRPEDYQNWSDKIDEFNEEHPDIEL